MVQLAFLLSFLMFSFSSIVYAGYISSLDFLYFPTPKSGIGVEYLEMNIKIDGNCKVLPIRDFGEKLIVDLDNCRLKRARSFHWKKEGIEQIVLLPRINGSRLIVDLIKPGYLKVIRDKGEIKLRIFSREVEDPLINIVKMHTGELLILKFSRKVNSTFKKTGNILNIFIPEVSLISKELQVKSSYVKRIAFFSSKHDGLVQGVIKLYLNPSVTVVKVTPEAKELLIYLYGNSKKDVSFKNKLSKKISLHFTNADVRSIVGAIARIIGVNVVFTSDASARVTVDFSRPVSWEDALTAILDSVGMGWIREKNSIIIYSVKDSQRRNKITKLDSDSLVRILETKKREIDFSYYSKEKNLEFESNRIDLELKKIPLRLNWYVINLHYIDVYGFLHTVFGLEKIEDKDIENLYKDLKKLLGLFKYEEVLVLPDTNSLLLRVIPEHYMKIKNMIRKIDVPKKQVIVKAKILEIEDTKTTDKGISWFLSYLASNKRLTLSEDQVLFNTGNPAIGTGSLPNSAFPLLDISQYADPYSSVLDYAVLTKKLALRLQLALKALEIDGNAKVLASPNVLVQDNQFATIEQGVEIPYREATISTSGATTYNVKFRKASLLLQVKPHIEDSKRIRLYIKIAKDSPNYEYINLTGNTEPAINTKSIETTLTVRSGDTIVIGGIYEKGNKVSLSGVPIISKIPLIGWLFKHENKLDYKKNLIILLTPKIMDAGK